MTEKVKPKAIDVVWAVRRHERSIPDLEDCGCAVCKQALKILEADE